MIPISDEPTGYIKTLNDYIQKKNGELYCLKNSLYFCGLVGLYKSGEFKNIKYLENIARNPVAFTIADDAFYIIYCVQINRGDVSKTLEIPIVKAALDRIINSDLFSKNKENEEDFEKKEAEVQKILAEYDKFNKTKDVDALLFVMDKAPISQEEKEAVDRYYTSRSCLAVSRDKKHSKANKAVVAELSTPNLPTLNFEEDIKEKTVLEKAREFFEKYKYIIETDDDEKMEKRIQMSSKVDFLNTSDYEYYPLEDRLGILLYSLTSLMIDYKEAEAIDEGLKRLYEVEIEKQLLIGKDLVANIEEKEHGVK